LLKLPKREFVSIWIYKTSSSVKILFSYSPSSNNIIHKYSLVTATATFLIYIASHLTSSAVRFSCKEMHFSWEEFSLFQTKGSEVFR